MRNARDAESRSSHHSAATVISAPGSIERRGTLARYERDSEIFGEDEPARYFYKVVTGAVRCYKILADGRRQICAFYLPGDIFGLELDDSHTQSAEAIADTRALVFKKSAIIALALHDKQVAQDLLALTSMELHRTQKHLLLLVKNADERVAGFLLDLMQRKRDASEISLPMPRRDIADYLGLTIETVSRTLSRFRNSATISLSTSRQITIRNCVTLNRLNS